MSVPLVHMHGKGVLLAVFGLVFSVAAASGQKPLEAGEHKVVRDGVHLWYKIGGAKRPGQAPLVYLPGGPGYNSYSFEKTIGAQLEKHIQMVYLDERGTGRSERPLSRDYSMETLVQDVEALRKAIGTAKISLMGQSFGGTIALEYASRYPNNVQDVILVDGVVDIPDAFTNWQKEMESRYPAEWQAAMAGEDGKTLQKEASGLDACAATQARFRVEMDTLSKVDAMDFHHWQQFHSQTFRKEQDELDAHSGLTNTGELSQAYFSPGNSFLCYRFTAYDRLTMPLLIIGGTFDGAVDIGQLRTLAQHLPTAKLDEFHQSAHFPYAEEPVKFEQDVAAFIASVRR